MKCKTYITFNLLIFILFSNTTYCQNNKALKFSDKGTLITTLGNDTTFIHDYEIKGLNYSSRIISFINGVTYFEGTGTFDNKGNIANVTSKSYRLNQDGTWTEQASVNIYTTSDSTKIETMRGGNKSVTGYKDRFLMNNSGDAVSFQLFPFLAIKAPQKSGDSMVYKHVNAIGYRDFIIKRISNNEVLISSWYMGKIRLFTDKNNKLQKIDALGSSLNFTSNVYRDNRFETLKKQAENNSTNRKNVTVSTRDTVNLTLDDQKIQIIYWQPEARGRKVFGGIVPDHKFWRFGANNATYIHLKHPVRSGKTIVPAGEYALFAVPQNDQWHLKFNSRSRVWGTEYDAAFDVASIPLQVAPLEEHIEKFKINLKKTDDKTAQLTADWEKTRLSFNFENIILPVSSEKAVKKEIIINAPLQKVWQKWSTTSGLETFFGQRVNTTFQPMGPFEVLFFPDNPPGMRGAENNILLAMEEEKMISFTWNAPPNFPEIRKQYTSVIVRFYYLPNQKTKVTLDQIGFGNNCEWIAVAHYFNTAWETVLGRLRYSLEKQSIDWKNPPKEEEIKIDD